MGDKDTLSKRYLSRPDIFADAFNFYLFGGDRVIQPKDLEERDTTEVAVVKKMESIFADQKIRDVLKECIIRRSRYATLILLGIEAQDKVSYVMPVRDNLYDALNYYSQVDDIGRKHHKAKDLKGSAEFLSGFSKEDRIKPVITLCVCFDKTKWDGARSLMEMFDDVDPRLRPFINDYKINLITPGEIKDFSKFSSGLGQALEFIEISGDKGAVRDIIYNSRYEAVDEETIDIINTYTNTTIPKKDKNEGKVNMCKGLQDLIEEFRKEDQIMIDKEKKRANAMEERLNKEKERANMAKEQAKQEMERADKAEAEIKVLRAKLAAVGIEV